MRRGNAWAVAVIGGAAMLAAPVLAKDSPAQAQAQAQAADPALWTRQCVKGPDGKDACFVQQFAIAMPQRTVMLKVLFSYLGPQGRPRLQIATPLGILLAPGLVLTVDGRPPITLPVQVCQAAGCEVTVDLDAQALDQFRAGTTATVRYVTTDQTAIDLPIRLDGLAAALKTIEP